MTPESIARFIETDKPSTDKHMKIDLKKRNPVVGMLIQGKDYQDLKSKNFWRVVSSANLAAWKRTGNLEFAKIYSGAEFNKISLVDAV